MINDIMSWSIGGTNNARSNEGLEMGSGVETAVKMG